MPRRLTQKVRIQNTCLHCHASTLPSIEARQQAGNTTFALQGARILITFAPSSVSYQCDLYLSPLATRPHEIRQARATTTTALHYHSTRVVCNHATGALSMTSILTRSPLQHMSMNSAAHTAPTASSRRRSARHIDDDHEDAAPPAKKVKADTSNMTGTTKTNGAASRKGKKGV